MLKTDFMICTDGLAEFLTSLHMDVVTESSGDLLNVHVVLILEFDHACNAVHGRIQYKL